MSGYADLEGLMTLMTGDEKHSNAARSTLDVLWVLYDRILDISPSTVTDPQRDRFLLSKGHGPMAYYAVLTAKGFIPVVDLTGFGGYDSALGWHPDRNLIDGVEISSGSLGHGLSIAVGVALAVRWSVGDGPRIVCLVGDGELEEGSNHEAIALAARLELHRLEVVVIDNESTTHGWPGGIESRFKVEGWSGLTIDGHDHEAIEASFRIHHPDRPHVVVAHVEGRD